MILRRNWAGFDGRQFIRAKGGASLFLIEVKTPLACDPKACYSEKQKFTSYTDHNNLCHASNKDLEQTMPISELAAIISVFSLVISISSYGYTRIVQGRNRYWDRFAALARIVIEKPEIVKCWYGKTDFLKYFPDIKPSEYEFTPAERVFAEMYLDFFVEVKSLNWFTRLFVGGYPGQVSISNPLIQEAYKKHLINEYQTSHRRIMKRELAKIRKHA